MTITVGSVWKHKRTAKMRCRVISTMKYRGDKFIIYEVRPYGLFPSLSITNQAGFLRNWEHPTPTGDVP